MQHTWISENYHRRWRNLILSGVSIIGTLCLINHAGAQEASKDHARLEVPETLRVPTTPAKAPKGIKAAIVVCAASLRGCTADGESAAEAAKKIGWEATIYDGGASQQKQNAVILDAISAGANVILTSAVDQNFIQLGLNAAKKAGIPVLSAVQGTDDPDPFIPAAQGNLSYLVDVGPDNVTLGKKLAEWIIANSGGKANIVVFTDEEFASTVATVNGVLEGLKSCSGCTVQPLQKITASQVATTVGQQAVGYLQAHPEVDYLYGAYDPAAAAMINAIAQAGLADRVKVASFVGDGLNLDFIRNGRVQVVDGAYDNGYAGYALIDQAIRVLNHQPLAVPHGENTPIRVLDKTNLPPPGTDFATTHDYKSAYLKLWQ